MASGNRGTGLFLTVGSLALLGIGGYYLLRQTPVNETTPAEDEQPDTYGQIVAEIEQLLESLQGIRENLEAVEAEIAVALELVDEQRAVINEINRLIAEARALALEVGNAVDSALAMVDELERSLTGLKTLLDEMADVGNTAIQTAIQTALSELDAIRNLVQNLRDQLERAKQKIEELEQRLASVQATVAQLQQTNDQLKQSLQTAEANAREAMNALNAALDLINRFRYALELVDTRITVSRSGTTSRPNGVGSFTITSPQTVKVDWAVSADGAVAQCATSTVEILGPNNASNVAFREEVSACRFLIFGGPEERWGSRQINLGVGTYTVYARASGAGGASGNIVVHYKAARFLVQNVSI